MSDLMTTGRTRRGERGFTLIELLVVVTIIGILAAIVSVSVGGFTGKASVQAHKSTMQGVQAAVDAYIADHYDGSGAQVPPSGSTTSVTAGYFNDWYDTNGSVLAGNTWNGFFMPVSIELLTQSTTSVLANTTRTAGPYLRLGGNASIRCVFRGVGGDANPAGLPDTWQILVCSDTAQTAQ